VQRGHFQIHKGRDQLETELRQIRTDGATGRLAGQDRAGNRRLRRPGVAAAVAGPGRVPQTIGLLRAPEDPAHDNPRGLCLVLAPEDDHRGDACTRGGSAVRGVPGEAV